MWERVELPDIEGPIRGFTFPRGNLFYILTPGGLIRVALIIAEVRKVY